MAKLTPVAQVKADIDKIKKRATKLEKALSKGTKIGYVDGLKITKKSAKVTLILNKATSNAKAVPSVTVEDGQAIIEKVEALIPSTVGALEKTIELKPHFDKLKIAGIVKIVISQLESSQNKFALSMIEKAPSDELKAKGHTVKDTIDAAFAKATATYSNAQGGEEEGLKAVEEANKEADSDDEKE